MNICNNQAMLQFLKIQYFEKVLVSRLWKVIKKVSEIKKLWISEMVRIINSKINALTEILNKCRK